MGHDERKHATWGGSGAHRWLRCTASPGFLKSVPPQPPSEYAQDGTEAHELLEFALRNNERNAELALLMLGAEWTHRKDSRSDRLRSVQDALEYVYTLLDTYSSEQGVYIAIEADVEFHSVYTDDAYGALDFMLYVPSIQWMFIVDYKHGAGEPVEAEENEQGLFYGSCAWQKLRAANLPLKGVTIAIAQPRVYRQEGPVSIWHTTPERLELFRQEAENAIFEATTTPQFRPERKACRWCVKTQCKAYLQKFMLPVLHAPSVEQIEAGSMALSLFNLTPEEAGRMLKLKGAVNDYFKELENATFNWLMSGQEVPGFKIVEQRATRKIEDDTEEAAARFAHEIGRELDDVMPRSVAGVTAWEKMAKQAYRELGMSAKDAGEAATQLMARFTVKDNASNGQVKYTLASEEDSRPAVNRQVTAFANVVVLPVPQSDS